MTGPEIAAKTGLSPGSVRVNLHRGMNQLRQKLASRELRNANIARTGHWSDMSERYKKQAEYNEYLWEGSGEPDAEIQRLEQALEEFRATSLVPPGVPNDRLRASRFLMVAGDYFEYLGPKVCGRDRDFGRLYRCARVFVAGIDASTHQQRLEC